MNLLVRIKVLANLLTCLRVGSIAVLIFAVRNWPCLSELTTLRSVHVAIVEDISEVFALTDTKNVTVKDPLSRRLQ